MARRTIRRKNARRGVILMIVLALLVIFIGLALAFVVVASQANRGAQNLRRMQETGDPPEALLHQAFLQVIRGSANPASALNLNSLLEDMYGQESIRRSVVLSSYYPGATGQLITLALNAPLPQGDTYNGRIVTMVSGPAAGRSTVAAGYRLDLVDVNNPNDDVAYLVVMNFGGPAELYVDNGPPNGMYDLGEPFTDRNGNGSWDPNLIPNSGDVFVLNGRPFNGSTGGEQDEDYDAADLQNPILAGKGLPMREFIDSNSNGNYDPPGPGFPGEPSFDIDGNGTIGLAQNYTIPSLHRPATAFFGAQNSPQFSSSFQVRRQFGMYRPISESLQPWFTGSNPATWDVRPVAQSSSPYTLFSGPWDVDNDGDGTADSIWVDLGFPVQTTPDGRFYKPLFAIMVIDLDGKINLNAHGSQAQVDRNPAFPPADPRSLVADPTAPVVGPFAAGSVGAPARIMPFGIGYGAADVNPLATFFLNRSSPAFRDPQVATRYPAIFTDAQYENLLYGLGNVEGRYGERNSPGTVLPLPGVSHTDSIEVLNRLEQLDVPLNYRWEPFTDNDLDGLYDPPNPPLPGEPYVDVNGNGQWDSNISVYGSPMDTGGNGGVLLDLHGQPLYFRQGEATEPFADLNFNFNRDLIEPYTDVNGNGRWDSGERADNPYGLLLDRRAQNRRWEATVPASLSVDSPFTFDELEPLLRFYDIDRAALPTRLSDLLGPLDNERRNLLTAQSWDLPAPGSDRSAFELLVDRITLLGLGGPLTPEQRAEGLVAEDETFIDVNQNGTFEPGTDLDLNNLSGTLEPDVGLLAPELLFGLRMDLNRPFGNGADDNGNGIIDDPLEAFPRSLNGLDDDGDGQIDFPNDPDEDLLNERVLPGVAASPFFDHNNNGRLGRFDLRDQLARQRFARHLYVLMRLIVPAAYIDQLNDFDPAEGPIKRRRAREIAQWAANVVDYRDRDSLMTPFEYDVNPFDGWHVDGWVGLGPGPNGIFDGQVPGSDDASDDGSPGAPNITRGVVWGAERPELVMTETLAFHDRRTQDTNIAEDLPPPPPNRPDTFVNQFNVGDDQDFDQVRRPQGNLLIELFNPWGNNLIDMYDYPPTEFYTGQQGGIWLGKTFGPSPAWRIVVTLKNDDPQANSDLEDQDPELPGNYYFDRTILDPARIERIAYFTPVAVGPGGLPQEGQAAGALIHEAVNPPMIRPNQYAVVAPAPVVYFGQRDSSSDGPNNAKVNRYPRRMEFTAQGVLFRNLAGVTLNPWAVAFDPNNPQANDAIQQAVGIVVDPILIPDPAGQKRVRFSISEPPNGYPPGPIGYAGPAPGVPADSPDDEFYPNNPPRQYPNQPYDLDMNIQPEDAVRWDTTHNNFKRVHLQRLANPMLAWNPEFGDPLHRAGEPVNPYVTVDWLPVDLTVYSGEPLASNNAEPFITVGNINFDSRQRRGLDSRSLTITNKNNFWHRENVILNGQDGYAPTTGTKANPIPQITLGFLNRDPGSPGIPALNPLDRPTLNAYLNQGSLGAYANSYIGAPSIPGPWFNFPNRPFVSPMELLLVPSASAPRMFHSHQTGAGQNPYQTQLDWADPQVPNAFLPFPHLVNFFNTGTPAYGSPDLRLSNVPDLRYLLEYVQVPTRYAGIEGLLTPFADAGPHVPFGIGPHPFHPPFNRLSLYRDPGRVNFNTIFDVRVWDAVVGGFPRYAGDEPYQDSNGNGVFDPGVDPFQDWNSNGVRDLARLWQDVVQSRRGYGTSSDPMLYISDPPRLDYFEVPFRSLTAPDNTTLGVTGVDQTLLRRLGAPGNYVNQPLFADPGDPFPTGADNSLRSPYFRYQALQKLGNVATVRSNVYAVWITVGYFEVVPVQYNPNDPAERFPDGFTLGQEIGSDTGEMVRHRAFYIFDRSIPMAFERGETHNVQNGIVLERYIE